MRILIVSDAGAPQVNGVVRTLTALRRELETQGHQVALIAPDSFPNLACPTYPEIRLAVTPSRRLARLIEASRPCAIHIATEGPLGWAARRYCLKAGLPFTTAYHTRFPEYLRARFALPLSVSYRVLRHFHAPSSAVMVATPSIQADLEARGFTRIRRWSRGVDTDLFRPRSAAEIAALAPHLAGLEGPLFLYVGRIAVEKNIRAFLDVDLPGTKLVVGDGPERLRLARDYPHILFTGAQQGEALAAHYAAASAMVFPSRTDTFGLVLLEALASGTPVAAYPVPGPIDVIGSSPVGVLDDDLARAGRAALGLDREACRAHALSFSWAASAGQFLDNLAFFATRPWQKNEETALDGLTDSPIGRGLLG
ncbi:MAG: glycosyltransferase family 1 protein [Rhodospirillaceae bacterium]|nr:glycosyltransferase family 1 protein [Rhodospirillaceae bacterium]